MKKLQFLAMGGKWLWRGWGGPGCWHRLLQSSKPGQTRCKFTCPSNIQRRLDPLCTIQCDHQYLLISYDLARMRMISKIFIPYLNGSIYKRK
ncbi:hypothetical protein GDO81_006329 [Engystomops pustulosus]|uniref:Uncharacterized protein n=1 Tax=Engystomops pustulosus TaxID=76066 RepID=A0AAV7CVW4_ENGPU|nr:hypothetical protein GDO81_006329 [Engystomops pustulosus]